MGGKGKRKENKKDGIKERNREKKINVIINRVNGNFKSLCKNVLIFK